MAKNTQKNENVSPGNVPQLPAVFRGASVFPAGIVPLVFDMASDAEVDRVMDMLPGWVPSFIVRKGIKESIKLIQKSDIETMFMIMVKEPDGSISFYGRTGDQYIQVKNFDKIGK